MKTVLTLFCILIFQLSNACVCSDPNIALEFLESEYVFEGEVISKKYSEDYKTYKAIFKVLKHYKEGDYPKYIEYTFKSESEYTGIITSCDWSVKQNQKWLVFSKSINGISSFNYYCSNSVLIDNHNINFSKQNILDNGNIFKIDNFIYENEKGFNFTKPITNIDDIFKTGNKEDYKETFVVLKLLINKNGKLMSVAKRHDMIVTKDSIFNLPVNFELTDSRVSTSFENEAIRLANQIKKWEIKYYNDEIPVSYIKNLIVTYDTKNNRWSYEL